MIIKMEHKSEKFRKKNEMAYILGLNSDWNDPGN